MRNPASFSQPERQEAGFVLYSALTFSAAFALFKTMRARLFVMAIGLALAALMTRFASLNVPIVILLPTVIHISIFTFLFMLVGALRSRSLSQMLLILVYILSIVLIFVHPPVADSPTQGYASLGSRFSAPSGRHLVNCSARMFGRLMPGWPDFFLSRIHIIT